MSTQTIQTVLNETRVFPPSPDFVKQANISGMPAYAASKAGLDALTVAWARELGDWNITANAVAPGSIAVTPGLDSLNRTPEQQHASNRLAIARTPIQRLATREDIAGAVAYFASEEAGFVTGEALFVAGGFQLAPAARYASDPV
mgnify:CR=1 FL=1